MPSVIYLGGSRVMSSALLPAVQAVVMRASSSLICVGCATGADQAVIQSAIAQGSIISIFAAFAQSGAGSFSGSAVSVVQAAAHAPGVSVSWLAGGSLQVPLVARLMARSVAGLRGASCALFFAPGVGSLKVAGYAVAHSVPVHAVCLVATALPRGQAGYWSQSGQVAGFPIWSFVPAQLSF